MEKYHFLIALEKETNDPAVNVDAIVSALAKVSTKDDLKIMHHKILDCDGCIAKEIHEK